LLAFETGLSHRALHAPRNCLSGKDASRSVAGWTRLCHVLEVALANALAGHLDQAELADRIRFGARAVAAQVHAQLLHDLVAVRLRVHVDEVADDDAAQVAQPRLA